jgi:hypothetical protein
MITNNNSWSLGPTPNKSLDSSRRSLWAKADSFEPSIPIHRVTPSHNADWEATYTFRGSFPLCRVAQSRPPSHIEPHISTRLYRTFSFCTAKPNFSTLPKSEHKMNH